MNSASRAFTVRIFLANGSPEGIRIVEKSNWNGVGIVCPRPRFNQSQSREEFGKPGVYLLVGASLKSELPAVYIGEGDPVRDRLQSHNVDPKKDFWTQAIFFTGNLNKAHIQHLESRLISLARKAKRCVLENATVPTEPSLSEMDWADAEGFLEEVLLCLGVLGFDFFQVPIEQIQDVNSLQLAGKGLKASGYESDNGFVVKQASDAVLKPVPSLSSGSLALREKLIQLGVLSLVDDRYKFTQDYEFNAPSPAAEFVLGTPTNGRDQWKDINGRSMNEIAALKAKIQAQT
jgi:Domain of unknown function (DUF4357)